MRGEGNFFNLWGTMAGPWVREFGSFDTIRTLRCNWHQRAALRLRFSLEKQQRRLQKLKKG
jgi:hypothetical protein